MPQRKDIRQWLLVGRYRFVDGVKTGHTRAAGYVLVGAGHANGARLISGGTDFTARVWHVATGANLLTFRDHTDAVMDVAWSGGGTAVGTAGLDGAVRVWQGPDSSPPRYQSTKAAAR